MLNPFLSQADQLEQVRGFMINRARDFMVEQFGRADHQTTPEARDEWHRRLGLLVLFIDKVLKP